MNWLRLFHTKRLEDEIATIRTKCSLQEKEIFQLKLDKVFCQELLEAKDRNVHLEKENNLFKELNEKSLSDINVFQADILTLEEKMKHLEKDNHLLKDSHAKALEKIESIQRTHFDLEYFDKKKTELMQIFSNSHCDYIFEKCVDYYTETICNRINLIKKLDENKDNLYIISSYGSTSVIIGHPDTHTSIVLFGVSGTDSGPGWAVEPTIFFKDALSGLFTYEHYTSDHLDCERPRWGQNWGPPARYLLVSYLNDVEKFNSLKKI